MDDNTFLARSNDLSDVKTAKIPISGQSSMMTLGVVSMRNVLLPILYSSPELFGDASIDYSVYVKDISEEDEPFVGHGLFTKLIVQNLNQFDDEILIPGRVCSNFAALLSNRGGSSETLEVKLRLARVRSNRQQNRDANPQPQQQQPEVQQHTPVPNQPIPQQDFNKRSRNDSDTEDEDGEFIQPKKIQPQIQQRQRLPSTSSAANPIRITNSNPAPKAVRTQSLPAFNNPLSQVILPNGAMPSIGQRYPKNSIAQRIRQADNANSGKITYNFHVEGIDEKNAPIGITTEVSKRFADDFITKKPEKKKQVKKAEPIIKPPQQYQSKMAPFTSAPKDNKLPQMAPMSTNNSVPKTAPTCINCKTNESKAWRWNESDEEFKRGLFCNNCYIYLIDKGVMRPSYLFKKRSKGKKKTSAPTTTNSSSAVSTPSGSKMVVNQAIHEKSNNSSDPIDEFNDIISSDLDFHFDPMTDIDPLPQHHQHQQQQNSQSEDKENIPPPSANEAIPIKKASRQTSFEKMLAKSFSGVPPNMANTPCEWMSEFFEPTPRDQDDNTPKDFENNTPKDLATCNTLPCEDDSPQPPSDDHTKQQQQQQQPEPQPEQLATNTTTDEFNENRNMNKIKATTMPSSPFALQIGATSSPNSMHDGSDWLSEHTKLSSVGNEAIITNKASNNDEQFTSNENLKA